MKNTVLTLSLISAFLTAPTMALASLSQELPNAELCLLEEDAADTAFNWIEKLDVEEMESATPLQLKMLNGHLIYQQYTDKELSLEEMQTFFSEGDYQSDDLYLLHFASVKTGKNYFMAKSYPGDNPYGVIYDAAGNIVGYNSDGSISFVTSKGEVSCYDLGNN